MNMTSAAVQTETRKLAGIDASRGIAASLVVLYHSARHLDKIFHAPALKHIFQFGHCAIDFFFVISGFIILFVHYRDINRPGRVTHYFNRRAMRVLPNYWVALALTVIVNLAGHRAAPSGVDLAWSVSLLPNQHPIILDTAWTLQYEALFYLYFAVLIVSRSVGLLASLLWVTLMCLGLMTQVNFDWLPGPFWGAYSLEFFAGMAVAYTLRNHTIAHPKLIFLTGLFAMGLMCALEDLDVLDGYASSARLAYGLPAALIVLGLAQLDRQGRVRVPYILQKLGSASYSIYLYQFLFIGLFWQALVAVKADQILPIPILFIGVSLAGIVGGMVMSALVEQPIQRLSRRTTQPHQASLTLS
jgi:peptidoglycan/LPS O-acetylase OafA/YrhL